MVILLKITVSKEKRFQHSGWKQFNIVQILSYLQALQSVFSTRNKTMGG